MLEPSVAKLTKYLSKYNIGNYQFLSLLGRVGAHFEWISIYIRPNNAHGWKEVFQPFLLGRHQNPSVKLVMLYPDSELSMTLYLE